MSETIEHTTNPNTPYRVLARKYRPQTFQDLIGQDAMVRTLTNAFASGRIAQAYMLTGVRGVGKTTTARLIARALNYHATGEDTGPSIDLSEKGEHCDAIMESRHVDVIEMDAASHTGVDNVREINDAVKYKPASARYKVYIIDEVHMLSTSAFNALLKTLEEPPPHVKFIFATTEIRKVPVTVLSRCQRFDLRRLDAGLLVEHFQRIAELEGVRADVEALQMIARAAEGSVRDGLSLLDQAIAYGTDHVGSDDVQSMLGLSDRARIIDLFEAVMRGDAAAAMDELEAQHAMGADPEMVIADLAGFVHWVTKLKVSSKAANDAAVSQAERTRGKEFSEKLAMPVLARTWQMLLKGMEEIARAGNALMAAEMLLIRLAHVSDMPTPDELSRIIRQADTAEKMPAVQNSGTPSGGIDAGAAQAPVSGPVSGAQPAAHAPVMTAVQLKPVSSEDDAAPVDQPVQPTRFASFDDLVAYVSSKRDVKLVRDLERHVVPVSIGAGRIELSLLPDAPAGIANELSRRLEAWTHSRWIVSVSSTEASGQTIADKKRERRDDLFRRARQSKDVQAVLQGFPGAEILEVRDLAAEPAASLDEQPEFDSDIQDDQTD